MTAQLKPSLHRERHPVVHLESIQRQRQKDILVVPAKREFARSKILEYGASSRGSCHAGQDELQILEPPENATSSSEENTNSYIVNNPPENRSP